MSPDLLAVDDRALRNYRLSRVRAQLQERDYAAALLFDPINIRYATGSANMQVWTLHNAARYAFVPAKGPVVLFDFHNCEHLSEGIETVDEVRPACSWFYFSAGSRTAEKARRWAAEIADLISAHGGGNRRLALDHVDPQGASALETHGVSLHDGQEVLEQARSIKAPMEIIAIKNAIAVCEEGLRRMHDALVPGLTENELWSILHQTNIALGGEWIETRLLTSGPRTNPWFQECSDRVIEAGDLVSLDTDLIGPGGYCADISRTWLCGDGQPTDTQRRLYNAAYEEIEHNTALLKPGLSFREFLERSFRPPKEFVPYRYSAVIHGVGLCDEYPHVPYPQDMARSGYDGMLQENMTVCVESYVGAVGGRDGVKLEQQVLISRDGPVLLSSYPFEERFL
ncbi:MAG: M24 family metallopeptidase [Acidiferrobacterales bacterium]